MRAMKSITRILAPILVAFVATVAWAQNQPSTPVKIAILPFTMNTPSDLAYLKDGIRDMLTSRLVWQGKVQIVDRTPHGSGDENQQNVAFPRRGGSAGQNAQGRLGFVRERAPPWAKPSALTPKWSRSPAAVNP